MKAFTTFILPRRSSCLLLALRLQPLVVHAVTTGGSRVATPERQAKLLTKPEMLKIAEGNLLKAFEQLKAELDPLAQISRDGLLVLESFRTHAVIRKKVIIGPDDRSDILEISPRLRNKSQFNLKCTMTDASGS